MSSVAKLMSDETSVQTKLSPQQKSHQQEIENSILVLAAEVIRCDKNFTDKTEAFVHDYLNRQFGSINRKHRSNAVNSHLETGTEPFVKIACKELSILTTLDSRVSIVRFLFGVAAADNFVNEKETKVISRISRYLGINEKDFKEIKHVTLAQNNPYHTLGVDEGATWEQIKQAYRKMILKHHPDKRTANVSEEEAGAKFREIQKAFELLKGELRNE